MSLHKWDVKSVKQKDYRKRLTEVEVVDVKEKVLRIEMSNL